MNWLTIRVSENGNTKYYSEEEITSKKIEIEIYVSDSAYEFRTDGLSAFVDIKERDE